MSNVFLQPGISRGLAEPCEFISWLADWVPR